MEFGKEKWLQSAPVQVATVNLLCALGVSSAALGAQSHLQGIVRGGDLATIAQAALLAFLQFLKGKNNIRMMRFAVFLLFSFCAGLNVGTWITNALQDSGFCEGTGHWLVPDADSIASFVPVSWRASVVQCEPSVLNATVVHVFQLTVGTYISLCFATFLSPRRGMFKWMGYFISQGLWILFGTYWLARMHMIALTVFDTIYIKLGLILYSFKVVHDTEVTMQQALDGTLDVIDRAVTATLNILHIFIRLIQIIGKSKNRRK